MDHNPYSAKLTEAQHKVQETKDEIERHKHDIRWHAQFDPDEITTSIANLGLETAEIPAEISALEAKSDTVQRKASRLNEEASLGFNPFYWFSDERFFKEKQYQAALRELHALTIQTRKMQSDLETGLATRQKQQRDLDRYRTFDTLETQARVATLTAQLEQWEADLAQVHARKLQLDQLLQEPLAELSRLQRSTTVIKEHIAKAEKFDKSLDRAENSYERKQIHAACSAALGDAKPGKVLGLKQRELESVQRNIGKLEERIRKIVSRSLRVVTEIVIDGNNLCYEQNTFIGLAALLPVAQMLSTAYPVRIIFDASIRHLLQMKDEDIAAQFNKTAKVHVVATQTKADETILDTAEPSDIAVISNDRFAEFPDKPVVRDQRVIRHEILNGMIFIHDLGVSCELSAG